MSCRAIKSSRKKLFNAFRKWEEAMYNVEELKYCSDLADYAFALLYVKFKQRD